MWMEHETVVLGSVFQLQAADHDVEFERKAPDKKPRVQMAKGTRRTDL